MSMNKITVRELRLAENITSGKLSWGESRELTVLLDVVKDASGDLCMVRDGSGRCILRIAIVSSADMKACSLSVDFTADAKPQPLELGAPWQKLGAAPHRIAVRYRGYRLELLVDGVLLDEEWPMGNLDLREASVLIGEGVEAAELYDRAVEDSAAIGGVLGAGRDLERIIWVKSRYRCNTGSRGDLMRP